MAIVLHETGAVSCITVDIWSLHVLYGTAQ